MNENTPQNGKDLVVPKHGEEFAQPSETTQPDPAVKSAGTKGKKRKPVPMKTNVETRTQFSTFRNTAPSKAAPVKELIAPHEWAALLNSFENEPEGSTRQTSATGEIEIESEDLWEKLSSTRWLKQPPQDTNRNGSTVAR
jgi:hypothetical protein